MNKQNNEPKSSTESDLIYCGGLYLPKSCGTQHFIVVGGPGSGKSTLLQLKMQSILPRIRFGTNRRAIIYDAKRDTFATLLGMGIPDDRVTILNPFDVRSAAWDMSKDICDPATAMEIGNLLVPEKGEVQPFFPEAARSLIGGIMEAFIHSALGRWTLRDVVLSLRSEKRIRKVLQIGEHTEHLASLYLTGTDAHADILATIENTMRRLAFVAAAWDNATTTFSLEHWIKSEQILLLGSNPCLESTVQQLNSAILHRASQVILNQPEAILQDPVPQTWVIIDELRRAGRLGHLPEFMVEGRSKGVCIALCFQDLPGLTEVWGHNLANELMGVPLNKGFLRISDPETASYASKLFGQLQLEVERTTTNSGTSGTNSKDGMSIGWQSGTSRQRVQQSRPAIESRDFMKIPVASPENGISGYFDLASIGAPYYCTLRGDFISQNVARPHPTVPNVIYRPKNHQVLREWDKADLYRLGLQEFPELLMNQKGKGKPGKSRNKATRRRIRPNYGDESGGLMALLPTRQ